MGRLVFHFSTLNQINLKPRRYPAVFPHKLQGSDHGQGNQLRPLIAQNIHCIIILLLILLGGVTVSSICYLC